MHIEPNVARLCARALSRPTFAALARGEDPRRVLGFIDGTGLVARTDTVGVLFEKAFEVLRQSYRSEYIYKTAIANRLVFGRHSPRTSSLSVELHVGRSIVDVAMFNGTSTAYEVKTELDSPRRLATQTPDYLRAFDKVYVVTHPELAERYAAICDERVGVLALGRRESLQTVREAAPNAANVDPRALFRILRKAEYKSALEHFWGEEIDVPNGVMARHCENLFSQLPRETAHRLFLDAMRARTTDKESSEFISALPAFLRVLGYATPLSRPQRDRALKILDFRLSLP